MGTVLAMMRGGLFSALLAGFVGLSACSNAPVDESTNSIYRQASVDIFNSLRSGRGEPISITRSLFANVDVPLLYVELIDMQQVATAVLRGRNGAAYTWFTANNVSLTIKDGVLFSTRGLGADLLTAETVSTSQALRVRSASKYPRVMRFISGDESIRKERYYCEMENDGPVSRVVLEIEYNTIQMRESCYAIDGNREFRNVYWIGPDGTIWDSRQWVSREIGYLTIQTLQK